MAVEVRLPLPDEQVFRYAAMDEALEILARNPTEEFSNRELQRLTGYGGPSVSKGLALLEAMGLIVRRDAGNRTLFRIDERRLRDGDDPLLEIPQAEFRDPLKQFVERMDGDVASIAGVLCFGSVARGEADRASDIDVFVLVGENEDPVSARRTVSDIVRDLEAEPVDGDRYEFEVFVESPESARKRGDDLRPILQEGIPLVESETLRRVKRDVFGVDG
ncbi:HTH domain protein [Natrialba magadii ATCC 43099]|uniref:DNA polymerase beta domain-containing protein n=1 Tax=Natrialba magadii (strain ATCC 43099 / DSM 3394 / CCM 3739 / CIP 104546 / IAM 13178 / JCM 8861 / NBRC 102185 / NCIMB 2190 / MS3) TaxID=547559 RepID=D3STQ4_NATMM|nr:nucleotidyltransferase domain-containing protein [Natrialba magadii]ADD05071.1 HTH domain protein [Natrialba magadii ATCC 43099]ELY23444.1 DNA polymerase beta domain-containing protein [Natrialba magadii ATCC 43099]